MRLWFITVVLAVALACSASEAQSTGKDSARDNQASILLTATLPSQLRLSLSDAFLDINISDPTQPSATAALPVTSSWVLDASSSQVELVAFFDSPVSALTDGAGDFIPANHVLGGLTAGDMQPFAEISQAGAASRILFRQSISRANVSASRSDTLNIQVMPISDLGAHDGDYRGVLHLRLIAF